MPESIYITGLGTISSIGDNVDDTLDALKNRDSGIGDISILDTRHKGNIPAAEVKHSLQKLHQLARVDLSEPCSRTALLGIIAASEAFHHAGLDEAPKMKTGLVSATTVGGIDITETVYQDFLEAKNREDPHQEPDEKQDTGIDLFRIHDCGHSTEKIGACLNITNFMTTISTACSSSANAVMFGARLIQSRIVDRVIAGGTDGLALFTINGFNSLMILDKEKCRPFDKNRKGLTLGEGAGYLVLESERSVKGREKNVLCELRGFANTCDAFHQTASSPDGRGAFLAMQKALKVGGLNPGNVDYINAHGTGTPNNDLSEGRAVQRLFGTAVPPVSSTKGYTGHTLGAAGGIEAVISVLTLKHGLIFPNLHFRHQMDELDFAPVTEVTSAAEINTIMSNSFGFGGNNTCLVFSRSRL